MVGMSGTKEPLTSPQDRPQPQILKKEIKNMEIVKRKIEIVFNEEEKQTIEKVIDLLTQIEGQADEVINTLHENYEDYSIYYRKDNPLMVAIDYLGSLINYGED